MLRSAKNPPQNGSGGLEIYLGRSSRRQNPVGTGAEGGSHHYKLVRAPGRIPGLDVALRNLPEPRLRSPLND